MTVAAKEEDAPLCSCHDSDGQPRAPARNENVGPSRAAADRHPPQRAAPVAGQALVGRVVSSDEVYAVLPQSSPER